MRTLSYQAIIKRMMGFRYLAPLAALALLAGCKDDGWGQDTLELGDPATENHAAVSAFPFPAPLTQERFPARAPVMDAYSVDFYEMLLRETGEPALGAATTDMAPNSSVIRFIWTPSFHHFVIVRIVQAGDRYRLIAHQIPQRLSPDAAHRSVTRDLTAREAADVHRLLDRTRIRYERSEDPHGPGLDGAGWLIELADPDHYLLLSRWSPETGPVREVGEKMLQLTGWRFSEIY